MAQIIFLSNFNFEKKWRIYIFLNDRNALIDVKCIKILMLKFLGGGGTFIQGARSIPDSKVSEIDFTRTYFFVYKQIS